MRCPVESVMMPRTPFGTAPTASSLTRGANGSAHRSTILAAAAAAATPRMRAVASSPTRGASGRRRLCDHQLPTSCQPVFTAAPQPVRGRTIALAAAQPHHNHNQHHQHGQQRSASPVVNRDVSASVSVSTTSSAPTKTLAPAPPPSDAAAPAAFAVQPPAVISPSSRQPPLPYNALHNAPAPASGTVTSYEDEYWAVPGAELPLEAQVVRLQALLERLREAPSMDAKVEALRTVDSVVAFLNDFRNDAVSAAISRLDAGQQLVLLSLPAMLQQHVLMEPAGGPPCSPESLLPRLTALAARLARVEQFYDSVGGLLGYQLKSLQLIVAGLQDKTARQQQHDAHCVQQPHQQRPPYDSADLQDGSLGAPGNPADGAVQPLPSFHVPRGMDLAGEEGSGVGVAAAAQGLATLPFMAEVYPVGGAGDRLGLVDEATGESLPAAMLPYAGRTLMEALLRDLQAREYLYFHLTGRQVTTPVAIMTSDAKGNHDRVSRLLAELQWAGRGQEAFRLFRQPMVPVVAVEDGRWLLSRPQGPMMKPGGHGAIWKLMWDEGVFDWLTQRYGRRAALVRQISNPMAGTDTTLLALAGAGSARRGGGAGAFGFMSCERAVGAAEGMNVLQERRRWVPDPDPTSDSDSNSDSSAGPRGALGEGREGGGSGSSGEVRGKGGRWVYEYGVTNVEYTEFERLGLSDEAVSATSKTSVFPANTNVLFVGLYGAKRVVAEAIARADGEQLLPGLIFNLNKKVSYTDPLGGPTRQVTAGRMESTMQNLADYLTDRFDAPQDPKALQTAQLSTFLVSNLRRKVTSSAKKRREPGSARIAQTPDGSFYDLQRNAWQVLQRCGFKNVPEPGSPEQYLAKGPGFIFLFHPALGPLWDVISQKVVGGSLAHGSELVLEVAEVRMRDVDLDGSLQVNAENVMGHLEYPPGLTPASAAAAAAAEQHTHGSSSSSGAAAVSPATLAISTRLRGGAQEVVTLPLSAVGAAAANAGAGAAAGAAASVQQRHAGDMSPAAGAGAGLLRYGRRCGRVQMVNVRIRNAGIDWTAPDNVYWKHQVSRRESCKVVLLGQSEFHAQDVTLTGSHTFVVPDGYRLSVTAAPDGSPRTQLTPLRPATPLAGYEPSWEWRYVMDTNGAVRLSYVGSAPRTPAAGMVATVMAAAERRAQCVLDFNI